MDLPRRKTAMSLGALARRGWLLRARRGLYYVLPLEAQPGRPTISEDPWVLAREAFSPCYIGGWSAAEHWGLTEQLFRSTLVVTAKNFRTTKINVLGNEFRLFRVPHSRIAGTINVWRGRERVPISDRERTIIDALRRPELCGGVRHLADIMREYGRSAERDFRKLANVAREFANGATWKRLGYLAEVLWPEEKALAEEARNHLTAGIVKLDPRVSRRGTLLRRWGLWINAAISKEA
jgi:predicted transcriptional regulator of viral defense system